MSLYARASSDAQIVKPALSQAVGYVVVVLIGLIIAIGSFTPVMHGRMRLLIFYVVMIFVTRLLKKTAGEDNTKTEMYARQIPSSGTSLKHLQTGS